MKKEEVKKAVRQEYAKVAESSGSCCPPEFSGCGCGGDVSEISREIGYSDAEINSVPEGANLGLGCGNPTALAEISPGDTVLDLGSGAGFDCFIVAGKVGPEGRVIGVDMTPEMLSKARENALSGGYANVEFRLGEIECLPISDNSVDAVISNCVINLSTDKKKVFAEAYRALKPGGRLLLSDIVLLKDLPPRVAESVNSYVWCISGAIKKEKYIEAIKSVGFEDVEIVVEKVLSSGSPGTDPVTSALAKEQGLSADEAEATVSSLSSIQVRAVKPTASA